VAGLVEAIEKYTIVAGQYLYLFCERLAKFGFAGEVVKLADEVREDPMGHFWADQAIGEFKFKNALIVDPVRYDAEEPPAHLKRAQIGNGLVSVSGVGKRSQRAENLSFEDDFNPRTEN